MLENITKIASSFGVSRDEELSLLNAAGAYGVFAQQGVYFGQTIADEFSPVTLLRVAGQRRQRLARLDNATSAARGHAGAGIPDEPRLER